MNKNLVRTYQESQRELYDAALAFVKRFNLWIMKQPETIKFGPMLMFGNEYSKLLDALGIPEEEGKGDVQLD